jgi:predicted nucleotidyltransferase
VVFLGGAATGLLLSDPGASPIRPTKDVDVIIEIGSRTEYRALEKALQLLGFKPDRSEGAPLCRWLIDGMILDVMPTDPSLLGFSNRWYPEAMREAMPCGLPGGTEIRVVSAPYFLATKLEAFLGRGGRRFHG